MMCLFEWFDAHCAWIYNNMCIFNWMFSDKEAPMIVAVLKIIFEGVWFTLIIAAPLVIIVRGVGYAIGGWIGALPACFVDDDD